MSLGLVMIVKDEAAGIGATLASVKSCIDRWTVLDTGSTDGTQDLVRAALAGVPGVLYEAPIVTIAQSRNDALDLAGDACTHALILDAEETLVGGAALRAFCADQDHNAEAYHVQIKMGGMCFDSVRLLRASAGWRYAGIAHAIPTRPGAPSAAPRVPGVSIVEASPGRSVARWRRDKVALEAAARAHPDDARTAFYLAQTYECLGEYDWAYAGYMRRVAMGGWPEEVYEAKYRMARVSAKRGRPWPKTQQLYLDAYTHSPHRAEPLYEIALHWHRCKNHALTYLFANRGAAIPYPAQCRLFVQADVYEWRLLDLVGSSAYYVGAYAVGRAALEHLLMLCPGDPRFVKNLGFYTRVAP